MSGSVEIWLVLVLTLKVSRVTGFKFDADYVSRIIVQRVPKTTMTTLYTNLPDVIEQVDRNSFLSLFSLVIILATWFTSKVRSARDSSSRTVHFLQSLVSLLCPVNATVLQHEMVHVGLFSRSLNWVELGLDHPVAFLPKLLYFDDVITFRKLS